MGRYEQLGLWTRNIGVGYGGGSEIERERLRVSYRQFWNNAITLSREIQRDLSNLTLHDEVHFEALWERADQIAGETCCLTPLEVFVLGGAILLHDAANCLAAFPGRLSDVEATPEWRDAVADWNDRFDRDALLPLPPDARSSVLLDTLRSIHAERARTLASFEVNVAGERYALLQDDQLRSHIGPLMGEIAASHHWDISKLQQRLGGQRGSIAGMPTDWTVRPVLLACLLRCADATQLDQERAPDFLYGLLKLHGLSENHWRAQNRLAHPHVDPEDRSALVFTSTREFTESDAQAWWIAHDAIQVANRELQSSNNLIRDMRISPFQVNRIRGAESPDRLSEFIRVKGWRPVSAEVKVTHVDKIVAMFGGEKLYGHQMYVPIREIIQNSVDAIRFRREVEPEDANFEGKITVRLREEGEFFWIDIEDDGIGMSEAVITGPLIDFGSSYISSSLVKSERPGLLSKGRKRIGKFGVGFFSAFMITDEISVTSKPFDAGVDACRTLKFADGATIRPVLLEGRPKDFSATLSTRVSLKLTRTKLDDVLTFSVPYRGERELVSLAQLIGTLCPMLDVDVFVHSNGRVDKIHSCRWYAEDRLAWLKRITVWDLQDRPEREAQLIEAAGRLSFIDPDDPSAGLATIAGVAASGVATVGTLRATGELRVFNNEFEGAIDYEATDPRRGKSTPRALECLPLWASEQARSVAALDLSLPQRQYIAQRVAQFGGDATPIASILFNREWVSLEEAFQRATREGTIYIPVTFGTGPREYPVMTVARERHSGWIDNYYPGELEFVVPAMEGDDNSSAEAYYSIPVEERPAEQSFLNMFYGLARQKGYAVEGEFLQRVEFARYVGKASPRQHLYQGKMIGCLGLRLILTPEDR